MKVTEDELAQLLHDNPDLKVAATSPVVKTTENMDKKTQEYSQVANESEADFQKRVIKFLQEHGYKVCEFRKARRQVDGKDVFRTPFGADGVGFTDLVAVKPPRVLFIEDKSDAGKLSPEQIDWAMLLAKCPSIEMIVLSPAKWDEFVKMVE